MSPTEVSSSRLVVVLRAQHASEYGPVIEALVGGGADTVEITLSTRGALEELPTLIKSFGSRVRIGVGTVTTPEEATAAVAAGARFLVTPIVQNEVVKIARDAGLPVFPGALTPTEIIHAWNSGATAVKVFPASIVGPSYLRDLAGPFPHLRLIPSGGVGIDDVEEWFSAGAIAVSVGSPLILDAFQGGDLGALRQRTRNLTERISQCQGS